MDARVAMIVLVISFIITSLLNSLGTCSGALGLIGEVTHIFDQFDQHFAGEFDVTLIFVGVHFVLVVDVEAFELHASRNHVDSVVAGDGGVGGFDGEFVDGDVQLDFHGSDLSFGKLLKFEPFRHIAQVW